MAAKQTIKNASRGYRTFNVNSGDKNAEGNPIPQLVTLGPGEERDDIEVFNPDDRVFRGMVNDGDIVLGGKVIERSEEHRFRSNPKSISDREAAEAAGHTEGLADPLPADTDTEGGEEAEEARERLRVDNEAGEAASKRSPRPRRRTTS